MKKTISALICLVLVICTAIGTTPVFGAKSGACGDGVEWSYNSTDHILTISGDGAMNDFTSSGMPWASFKAEMISVVIGEGVSSIGANAFYLCTSLTDITIPASVTGVGSASFKDAFSLSKVRFVGTAEEWSAVSIASDNGYLTRATVEYISHCDAYGHTVDVSSTVAASCTASGTVEGICTVCGGETYTVTPPLGHAFAPVVKESDTRYTRECTVCGFVDTYEAGADPCFAVLGSAVRSGDTFTVPVLMTANPGICSAVIYVYFDPALKFESWTIGDVFLAKEADVNTSALSAAGHPRAAEAFSECGVDPANYKCICAYFDSDNDTYGSGVIINMTFSAPGASGEYVIGVVDSPDEVFNTGWEDIPFALSDSTVTVGADETHVHEWDGGTVTLAPTTEADGEMILTCSVCGKTKTAAIPMIIYGDVNGDKKVTSKDVSVMKKYIAGALADDEIVFINTDITKDGKITSKDTSILKRIIAGSYTG